MKKRLCFVLILTMLVGCLAACNVQQNAAGVLAGESQAAPNVEKMMTALVENSTVDAKNLLHPQVTETSDDAIAQMSEYLRGKKVGSMEQQSINVSNTTGTSGKARQEQVSYRVAMTDGAVIYLSAVYLSNDNGTGFTSFQLVLGVV